MNSHPDPAILQLLQTFARRRRRLLMLRGGLITLAVLVVAMILVAALDYWLPLMRESLRWAFSLSAYALVLVVAWRQWIRPMTDVPDERRLARIVEHAAPNLHEDLLSAVELGQSKVGQFDSAQFRALLQSDVAARVQGVEVKSLLPVGLLNRYFRVTSIIGVLVLALMIFSGLRFGNLLLRLALMPGANLDRVSATQIVIIEPNPPSQTVPQGDALRLEIELQGRPATSARLETEGASQGRVVTEMTPLGNNRFATAIQVGRENLRYRVQAGDGLTRRYDLKAVARPYELAFEKTYQFPDYSQMKPTTVQEPGGGLSALEGTMVDLKISTSQKVKSGELRLEQGVELSVVLLTPLPDGRLAARVPMSASGSYRVHLVAADTGFDNKFSPEYELRAEPDLAPVIKLTEPDQDLVAAADQSVKLVATVSDDIGLARIIQHVKVNEGEWKQSPLKENAGRHCDVEFDWDLASAGVKPGDVVSSKLVATDLKGQSAESRILQVLVVANRETNRVAGLASRSALYQSLQALAAAAVAFDAAALLASNQFDQSEDSGPNRKPVLAGVMTTRADCEAKLSQAWQALNVLLRDGAASHESSDLVLLGRLLGNIHNGELRKADRVLGLLDANPAMPSARELMRAVHESSGRMKSLTILVRDVEQFNLSAGQVDVVGELTVVLGSQVARIRTLAQQSKTPDDWQQVATRMRALLSVSKSVDAVLETMKNGGGPLAADADGLLNGGLFLDIQDWLQRDIPPEQLIAQMMDQVENFNRRVGKIQDQIGRMRENFSNLAAKAVTDQGKMLATSPETPAALVASMHQRLMEEVTPTSDCVQLLRQEQAALAKLLDIQPQDRTALDELHWQTMAATLKVHADLEETRNLADNAFVSDLRRATLAVQAVQTLAPGDGVDLTSARLDVVEQSLRMLETGHNLQELVEGCAALVAMERWEFRMPQGRTVERRDWAWLATRVRMAPGQFVKLEWKDEVERNAVAATVAQLREIPASPPFLTVEAEMGKRRNLRYAITTRNELEQVSGKLRAALAPLQQSMETARRNLAKLAPKISELALALAKEEAELKKLSAQQVETAATTEPAENSNRSRPQWTRQQQINLKIDSLKDLIRADANEQNILKKDERDRMRDADDAIAMLKDPPPAAARLLLSATQGVQAEGQKTDLVQAVEQEQKVVDALIRIGLHFEALEQGKDPDQTRAELRKAEEELGIKDALDEQFGKAEVLAEMTEQSPEEMLKDLEARLPTNLEMQRELDQIANTDLALARDLLQRAAKAEAGVATTVDEQKARDENDIAKLGVLDAARLAAACVRESQTAAASTLQLIGQAANPPAKEHVQLSNDQVAAAISLADEIVVAAQRLEAGQNIGEIVNASAAVTEKVGLLIPPCNQVREHANPAAQIFGTEAKKVGPDQAIYQQAEQQATLCAQKSDQAIAAARQAEAAARLAAECALAMEKIPQGAPVNRRLAVAALRQMPVKIDAADAAVNLERAARHEQRLNQSDGGQNLTNLAAQVDHAVKNEVSAAESSLSTAPQAAVAQASVQKASAELARLADALKQVADSPSASSPMAAPPSSPATSATPAEQQAMARALDALDQQLNEAAAAAAAAAAKGGPPMAGNQPGPPGGMAQGMMASMRQGRSSMPSPKPGMPSPEGEPMEKSLGGAKLDAAGPSQGQAPELQALQKGDWGKLPKKLAEQLSKGQTETIPAEYREAVATYYRVIAEKSKKP